MTSPSLLSRESTTLSPRCAQYGHFMRLGGATGFGLIRELTHAGHVESGLRGEHQAEQQRRADGEGVQHDRRTYRRVIRRTEEGRRAEPEHRVEAADGA